MDMEFLGDSSCVAAAGFEGGYLTVQFQDSTVYTYEDVDPYTWRSFKMSTSKGWFFNTRIRNNYSFYRGSAPSTTNTKLYDKAMEPILEGTVETVETIPEIL